MRTNPPVFILIYSAAFVLILSAGATPLRPFRSQYHPTPGSPVNRLLPVLEDYRPPDLGMI
jgi:hypothetical protein